MAITLVALATMIGVSTGCTVGGSYANHGFVACYLQVGSDLPTTQPGYGPMYRYPIVGEALWEACFPLN